MPVRLLRAFRPHAGHRLVEQEGLRAERQRNRDLELAALAMRKLGRRHAGAVGKADALQRRHGRLDQDSVAHHRPEEAEARSLPRLHRQHDVAQRRKFRRQRRDLEAAPKAAPRPLGHAERADILAEKTDRCRCRA